MTRHQPFDRHDGAIIRDFRDFLRILKAYHVAVKRHGKGSPEATAARADLKRAIEQSGQGPAPPPSNDERTES
jgi:hypothetical protein